MADDTTSIVIDNGSDICKAGYASDDVSITGTPSVVGYPKESHSTAGLESSYVGDDTQEYRDMLALTYPIKKGLIEDWDAMEKVWEHIFRIGLKDADPSKHPVLLTESPVNPKDKREKSTEIMFEKFNTPELNLSVQAMLSLYGNGRTTGLVVDSGHGVTHVVPLWEGFLVREGIKRFNIAGQEMTKYLQELVCVSEANSLLHTEHIREIKEKFCYVALDYDKESQRLAEEKETLEKPYVLPDGTKIVIGDERFRCPEALFKADLMYEANGESVQRSVFESVCSCEIDIRKELYRNILLAGGTTMFPGFPERLQIEVQALIPPNVRPNILADKDRKYSVWIGGCILCSLDALGGMWIKKEEYDEIGAAIVHRKCS